MLSACVLAVGACSTIRRAPATPQPVRGTLKTGVLSKYELPNDVTVKDRPVMQTDFNVIIPEGIQLNLWHSAGLNDGDLSSDLGDEVEISLGYNGYLGDTNVSAGVSYFDLYDIGQTDYPVGDVLRPYVRARQTYDVAEHHALSPFALIETRSRVSGAPDLGIQAGIGAEHDWEFAHSWRLVNSLQIYGDSGSIGYEKILVERQEVMVGYSISDSLEMRAGFGLNIPLSQPHGEVGEEVGKVYFFGLEWRF